jgi:hypothetical protein
MTDTLTDLEDLPQKGLVAPRYMGTLADQKDMSALGRVQVLRVSIGCEFIYPMKWLTRGKREISNSFPLLDLAAR